MTIDDYVKALLDRVGSRIPSSVRAGRIRELKTHLSMAAEEYGRAGLCESDAARRAVLDLGDPRVVANDLVRQYRGYGVLPARELARWLGPIVFVGIILPYIFLAADMRRIFLNSGMTWIWAASASSALIVFSIRIARTRRWLVRPVIGWVVAASILSVFVSGVFSPARPTGENSPAVKRMLATNDAELKKERLAVEQWQKGRPPLDLAPMQARSNMVNFYPLFPFPIEHGSEISASLVPMAPSAAEAAWKTHGAELAASLDAKQQALDQWTRSSAANYLDSRMFFARVVWLVVSSILIAVGQLVTWNGLVLLLATVFDESRNKRLRRLLQ